jgi:hypothetical protein
MKFFKKKKKEKNEMFYSKTNSEQKQYEHPQIHFTSPTFFFKK